MYARVWAKLITHLLLDGDDVAVHEEGVPHAAGDGGAEHVFAGEVDPQAPELNLEAAQGPLADRLEALVHVVVGVRDAQEDQALLVVGELPADAHGAVELVAVLGDAHGRGGGWVWHVGDGELLT